MEKMKNTIGRQKPKAESQRSKGIAFPNLIGNLQSLFKIIWVPCHTKRSLAQVTGMINRTSLLIEAILPSRSNNLPKIKISNS
jgi:hypothetical protein